MTMMVIHLMDITGMITFELRNSHPELAKELQQITSKIMSVAREKYKAVA